MVDDVPSVMPSYLKYMGNQWLYSREKENTRTKDTLNLGVWDLWRWM